MARLVQRRTHNRTRSLSRIEIGDDYTFSFLFFFLKSFSIFIFQREKNRFSRRRMKNYSIRTQRTLDEESNT